jgi:hypothetical protein
MPHMGTHLAYVAGDSCIGYATEHHNEGRAKSRSRVVLCELCVKTQNNFLVLVSAI